MASDQPIGVFDSGVGGLSVLRELQRHMPNENYLYIGDSARMPYGPRPAATVKQFTCEAAFFLREAGAKAMVIACNTATVAALEAAREAFPDLPVIGVVESGCLAAVEATCNGHIALLATKGTIASGAHAARINELRPGTRVTGIAAPLFVALAEEGWMDGAAPDAVAERYLSALFSGPEANRPDCLILGCTHFPFLRDSIRKTVGERTALVDPAEITARQTRSLLEEQGLLRQKCSPGATTLSVTADPEHFAGISTLFLGKPVSAAEVRTIALG